MTGYKEAENLLRDNLTLLKREDIPVPIHAVLYALSKALILLTQSLEADLDGIRNSLAALQPHQE